MNQQTAETATSILLNQGLPGLCILALVATVVFLWRQNAALQEKLDREHEARLNDRKEDTKVLLEVHDQTNKGLDIIEKTLEHLKS